MKHAAESATARAGRLTQADRLVELARDVYEFGMSVESQPFAVARTGLRVARLITGGAGSLRAELARLHLERFGRTPGSGALADAVIALHGLAMLEEPVRLHLRQAMDGGALWLDLGDQTGRVVRVDASGWSVETRSPVLFRRSELSGVMCYPDPGDFSEMREFLNVGDEAWALILGWVVSAFFPDIQHPILALTGEQGTAKTSTAKMLGALVDPSPAPLMAPPRDSNDWTMMANGASLIGLDNLSHLPGWFSDALCRAITGEGLARRRLYSDADLVVTSFRKLVLVTGIEFGVLSADLIDRTIFVELLPIPDEKRQLESELWARFHAALPQIFGGLLALVAETMRVLPTVDVKTSLRMGDHVRVLAALDQVIGAGCVAAYERSAGRALEDAADLNPLSAALIALATQSGHWTGTASELLEAITPAVPPKGWPAAANMLSGQLKRLAPVLRESGVQVETARSAGKDRTRLIVLTSVRTVDGADD